jgi:hypothetical protein
MESFKKLVYSLEKRIGELEVQLREEKGRIPPTTIHYVTESSEFGSAPLDELDTFRFKHALDYSGGTYHRYVLTNPSPELKEYFEEKPEYKTICMESIGIRSLYGPDEVERQEYTIQNQVGAWVPVPKKLRDLLDMKLWEVSSSAKSQIPIQYYGTLTSSATPYIFKRTMKMTFANHYASVPHVTFHITPVPELNIQSGLEKHIFHCRIKEITTKYVEFEFTFGAAYSRIVRDYVKDHQRIVDIESTVYDIPDDLTLHWHATGPQAYSAVCQEECEALLG